jgi:hypothetical protein
LTKITDRNVETNVRVIQDSKVINAREQLNYPFKIPKNQCQRFPNFEVLEVLIDQCTR